MKRCSILISLLTLPFFLLPLSSQSFNLLMQVRQREITGLCIMETAPDSSIIGTVINEFGTKILDFTYNNGKAHVFNLIAPINKWYIRRVLRRDFQFILANINENGITVKRKKIKYSLTPIISSPLPSEESKEVPYNP